MKTNRRDFLKGFGVLVAGLLLPNGKEKEVATESVIYDVIVEPVEIEAGVGGVQFVRDDACCSCVLVGMKKAECCGMRNYVRDFDNSIDVVGTIKARLEWTRIVQENNNALDKIRQARQFMESRASACGVKIEVAKDGEQCDTIELGRAIWVTAFGDDANSGLSIDDSKKTISAALEVLRTGDVLNVSTHCDDFGLANRPFLGWSDLKDQLDDAV